MRYLFVMEGCPFCNIAEEAVIDVNLRLPLGERIGLINISSGDPRCNFLAKLYETNDWKQWQVPVLVVDNPHVMHTFQSFIKSKAEKTHIHSIWSKDHYVGFLLSYLRQGF